MAKTLASLARRQHAPHLGSMSDVIPRLNASLEGRYRIERELGQGGMATVFLATDLRHHRNVAVKVLKPELAAVVGADRFLAEIETTANLQHPHILPLFDSGEADGFLFYVMPYVEGESLRERLDREQELPIEDAVRIATNMAEALDYAHRQGVIHRDIKPANVLLQDGKPVIADLGIALAVDAGQGPRLTETGLSLGTPHYMSPEQATGDLHVGPATDIYALGCVLYEMVAGRPPFTGSTPRAVLGRIISTPAPSPTAERPSVPANVEAVITKALEKVPADRFGTAAGFASALGDPSFRHGVARHGAPAVAAPWKWAVAALGALSSVLLILLVSMGDTPTSEPALRVPLAFPEGHGLTDIYVALSPDGRAVAYRGLARDGVGLRYRRLDALSDVALPGATGRPFFSPDGEWVGFYADYALKRVRVTGGQVETIAYVGATGMIGASWSDSDTIYFSPGGGHQGVRKVAASGGTASLVTTAEGQNHWTPDVLPGDAGILFTMWTPQETGRALTAVALSENPLDPPRVLVEGATTPRYSPSGHLLYARPDGSLYGAPFDLKTMEITGPERRIAQGVALNADGMAGYDVSENGRLLYVSSIERGLNLGSVVSVSLSGDEQPIRGVDCVCNNPAYSGTGRYLAVGRGEQRLWVHDLRAETAFPVSTEATYAAGFWRPPDDGIAFASRNETHWSPIGRLDPVPVPNGGLVQYQPGSWSPDGRYLVFPASFAALSEVQLHVVDTADEGPPRQLTEGSVDYAPRISPDGRWLAFQSRRTGTEEVYLLPFPEGGTPIQVTQGGGKFPVWAPDMSEIYYRVGSAVHAVEISTEPSLGLRDHRLLFDGPYSPGGTWAPYDIHPNGGSFAVHKLEPSPSRLILVTRLSDALGGGADN